MIRPTRLHEALDHRDELGRMGQGQDGASSAQTSVRARCKGREVRLGQPDFVDVFVTGAQRRVGKPKHPRYNASAVDGVVLESKTE